MAAESAEGQAILASPLANRFAITGKEVYRGMASTVFLGIEMSSRLQVVIKVLLKANFTSEEARNAVNEIQIHTDMPPHRNVVHLLATEETDAAMLLVMPYTPHGDLWSLVRHSVTYCEEQAQNCASQMLQGLRHVHAAKIVHTDIKPHNFLLFRAGGNYSVQLCDFGLATRLEREEALPNHGVRGTSGWYSPEMLAGKDYTHALDLFGVGLILFRMLGGYEPFMPCSLFVEPVEFDDSCWIHISEPCRDLITKLLILDPAKRITAAEACEHPWVSGPPPPRPTQEQMEALCEWGPPPREDMIFWSPEDVPAHGRQNSFAGEKEWQELVGGSISRPEPALSNVTEEDSILDSIASRTRVNSMQSTKSGKSGKSAHSMTTVNEEPFLMG